MKFLGGREVKGCSIDIISMDVPIVVLLVVYSRLYLRCGVNVATYIFHNTVVHS